MHPWYFTRKQFEHLHGFFIFSSAQLDVKAAKSDFEFYFGDFHPFKTIVLLCHYVNFTLLRIHVYRVKKKAKPVEIKSLKARESPGDERKIK